VTTPPRYDEVQPGTQLAPLQVCVRRAGLVQYCGASGDFNEIHWSERAARSVGLPDVIAHGMLTMAMAVRVITDWAGDPSAVVEYGTRFTSPVVVPDDDEGTPLVVHAHVADKVADNCVVVELEATVEGEQVLGRAQALVRLT
jgi:acyl dehydratase